MAWLKKHFLLLVTVLIPTSLAILYYGLVASDIYISESRFVVRSPQKPAQMGMVGELLQNTGLGHAQDDTYSVKDYILSRDALAELDKTLKVRERFGTLSIDLLNRFPGLRLSDSFEELYLYYGGHVGVDYDASSSISTLTVRAFSAEDAHQINQKLVEMSEALVNTLNDRSRADLVKFAEHDVETAAAKAKEASLALSAFRGNHALYQPDSQAALQLQGVAKIQEELVATKAAIAQLKKISPDNPQLKTLVVRQAALAAAIDQENAKVASDNGSLSSKAPLYERLALDSAFADKQLATALAGLEAARSESIRKQIYLERIVQPSKPDQAMEPRRIKSVLSVFLVGLILWGVGSLLIASVREHAD